MAVAKVQEAHGTSDSTSALTVAITATTGNLLIVAASVGAAAINSISDGVNTWTAVTVSGGSANCKIWYAKNITGGALSVVFTLSASAAVCASIMEFSGADLPTPIRTSVTAHGTTTAESVGPTGAALATDYAVAAICLIGNGTAQSLDSRAFSTALASQTDEALVHTTNGTGSSGRMFAGFSHGPVAGPNTETFTGTINNVTPGGPTWSTVLFLLQVPVVASSGFMGFV